MLIDLPTAKLHLRIDGSDEDVILALYIGAAEQSALDYIGRQVYADADTLAAAVLAGTGGTSPIVVNDAIKAAILLILGHLYANRENVATGFSVAELPMGARSLLQPCRTGMGV